MEEIHKCWFCKRDDVHLTGTNKYTGYKYVECKSCLATGPKSVNEEYAIEWWNKWPKNYL